MLDLIGQFGAIRVEQLDAVVVVRVVRGADDDTGAGIQFPGQLGDGGGRLGAQQQDIDACCGQAGLQRRLEHVAGTASILAD